ncbi:MAG: transposase [Kiritimatiellia bacterium]|nr:transposase [Kiritimatiellia bacterium]
MRQARVRVDDQPMWYHCYNRIAGTRLDLPFEDIEKEQFVRLLHRVSRLYTVRVVAYQVMSNHFHLLCHAPSEEPCPEEICRRYKAFHYGKRTLTPGSPACRAWQARSRDVSWFMRHLQQLFTVWYNRSRPVSRRGSLWADRFKHTLLESGSAVWNCWTYIESNSVRAGMVPEAAAYRFCSYGAWRQSGRHPFSGHLRAVALPMLQEALGIRDLVELREAMEQALPVGPQPEASARDMLDRRVGYWTQGMVIGSKLFLVSVMRRYRSFQAVERHRAARMASAGGALYAWRRLGPVSA